MEPGNPQAEQAQPTAELRNIGVAAHIDAGKTTVSERFLFYTGVERRMGEVHEGTAVMDWMDEERKRGITISSAVTSMPWRGHQINLIDTPGHVDFTVEVERCMRVLDGGLLVIAGPAGVQAQTETVWRQMRRHQIPCIALLNQWDRVGCDEELLLTQLRTRLRLTALVVQMPIGSAGDFIGVVDLVEMRAWSFDSARPDQGPLQVALNADLELEAGVLRSELVDAVAELDDPLSTVVLEGREPGAGALAAAIRRVTLAGNGVPVFFGSARCNIAMQPVLDGVVDYLPSPTDRGDVMAHHVLPSGELGEPMALAVDSHAELAALAFKLAADPKEDLFYARIYAGTMRVGMRVWNPRTASNEQIACLYRMHADHREAIEFAGPGELVALGGLENTRTGDTLATAARPVALARLAFPTPVMTRTVEPEFDRDRVALLDALGRLEFEDPTFKAREDLETGQWLISGMGELHLEVAEQRLRNDFGLSVRVGSPRVAYQEVVLRSGRGEAQVDRIEDGPGGQAGFGSVGLAVEGTKRSGVAVVWAADCGVPQGFRPSMHAALVSAARKGCKFGFPLDGVQIRIEQGGSRGAQDAELCFVQAACQALALALGGADVGLREPLMRFEVSSPEEFAGGVMADLSALGATISEVDGDGARRVLRGQVALKPMFGFSTDLRSRSQGRATMTMSVGGYRLLSGAELEARGLSWS